MKVMEARGRRTMKAFVLAALMLPIAGDVAMARESRITAGDLLEDCKLSIAMADNKPPEKIDLAVKAGVCVGFVDSAIQTTKFMDRLRIIMGLDEQGLLKKEFSRPMFCVPLKVTQEQVIRVVVKYLEQHPKSHSEEALKEVTSAINDAWPCPIVKEGSDR